MKLLAQKHLHYKYSLHMEKQEGPLAEEKQEEPQVEPLEVLLEQEPLEQEYPSTKHQPDPKEYAES
jgi:hypothetical protein